MPQDPKARRRRLLIYGAALMVLTVAVFARGLGHGYVLLDDYSKVIENPVVTGYTDVGGQQRLQTPGQGYLIPVTVAVWASVYAAGDGEAWMFHAVSLGVHVTVVLLLFGFLSRWSLHWALLGAAVMAVHPVVVEPVAWVTGQKDLLAAGFALGATWLFVQGAQRGEAGRSRVALAVLLFVMAALSKPTTVLLPGAWLLWLFARRAQATAPQRRAWWMAGLGLVVGLGLGLLSWLGHDTLLREPAAPSAWGDGRALYALGLQMWHLLAPVDLHPLYFVAPGSAWGEGFTWVGVGVLAVLGYASWRGRHTPAVVLGLGIMVAAYLPVANLVSTPRQLADSYLYLPLAGGVIALMAAVDRWRETWARGVRGGLLPAAGGVLVVAGLATLSGGQVGRWAGGDAFWTPIIERWPDWDRGYYGLGAVQLRQRRDARAAALFGRAYRRGYRAEHLADFGVVLAASGRLDDAECVLVEAVRHGNRPQESLRNYARMMATRPGRKPRYPRVAALLVPAAMQAVAKRGGVHSRAILRRLEALRRRLGSPPGSVRWPRGTCPLLRPVSQGSQGAKGAP